MPYPSWMVGGSILSNISKLEKTKINNLLIEWIYKRFLYKFALDCPMGKVTTSGSQTFLNEKPGCGVTPGPTGRPAINAGG